jgi:hypothetical protein
LRLLDPGTVELYRMYMVWWEGGENSETQREGCRPNYIYDERPKKQQEKKASSFRAKPSAELAGSVGQW